MLENIVRNPIETPRGYKNSDNGIALRGPLSQFFSGLYLKPLDDAFNAMDVVYLRYQDDVIVLCKTKRQLERCKRRLMSILRERHLQLSRKKTRIGTIDSGFHFLGIQYLETQPPNNTCVPQDLNRLAANDAFADECLLFNQNGGGNNNLIIAEGVNSEQIPIVLHARTLRNAREQVKFMVIDGFSTQRIRRYLNAWLTWWVRTSQSLTFQTVLSRFIQSCHDSCLAGIAIGLLLAKCREAGMSVPLMIGLGFLATV